MEKTLTKELYIQPAKYNYSKKHAKLTILKIIPKWCTCFQKYQSINILSPLNKNFPQIRWLRVPKLHKIQNQQQLQESIESLDPVGYENLV